MLVCGDWVSVFTCTFNSFFWTIWSFGQFSSEFYKMAAALVAGIGAGLAYIGCVLCCKAVEHCQHKKEEEGMLCYYFLNPMLFVKIVLRYAYFFIKILLLLTFIILFTIRYTVLFFS